MMIEFQLLWAWAAAQLARVRDDEHGPADRGDGVLVWVVMVALLTAAAITIVAIVVTKAKTTASNTKTQ